MTVTMNSDTRLFVLAAAVVILTACQAKKETTPPVTQRQRDSLIGASSLPGARGVRGALAAQDSATKRKAVLDSIARADSK